MTDEAVAGDMRAFEAPDSFEAHAVVVERARVAGLGRNLADNDLYLALKAVHDAEPERRSRILEDGPLWAHYAGRGMEVANALLQIMSFVGYKLHV